jgi:hypothetical protein
MFDIDNWWLCLPNCSIGGGSSLNWSLEAGRFFPKECQDLMRPAFPAGHLQTFAATLAINRTRFANLNLD